MATIYVFMCSSVVMTESPKGAGLRSFPRGGVGSPDFCGKRDWLIFSFLIKIFDAYKKPEKNFVIHNRYIYLEISLSICAMFLFKTSTAFSNRELHYDRPTDIFHRFEHIIITILISYRDSFSATSTIQLYSNQSVQR